MPIQQVMPCIARRPYIIKLTPSLSITLVVASERVHLTISIHLDEIHSMAADPGIALSIRLLINTILLHILFPFQANTR